MTLSDELRATITRLAGKAGSKATTLRGMTRAARIWRAAHRRTGPGALVLAEHSAPCTSVQARRDYLAAEASRAADPDARRARDDAAYRKSYLARLAREERTLTALPGNAAALRERSNHYVDQTARLAEIARLRRICGIDRAPARPGIIGVKIGEASAAVVGVAPYRRCATRTTCGSAEPTTFRHTDGRSEFSKGRWRTVSRASHETRVRAVAAIDSQDPTLLHWLLHLRAGQCRLPHGYRWDVDSLGLRAVRADGADYHIGARDLLATRAVEGIITELAVAVLVRAVIVATKADATLVDLADVHVCAADSLRAGNCRTGTEAWIVRMKLSPAQHIPATVLVARATGQWADRILNTVNTARRRTAEELERGYCILTEHRAKSEVCERN